MASGKNEALVKPTLLRWARESADHTLESAAKAAKVTVKELAAWESDENEHPSMAQLRKLAAAYRRPLVVFYFPGRREASTLCATSGGFTTPRRDGLAS